MAKIKTLEKQTGYSKMKKQFVKIDVSKCTVHDPFVYLLDKNNILRAIEECVREKDLDGVIEMVQIYKRTLRDAKKFGKLESPATVLPKKQPESHRGAQQGLRAATAKNRVTKKIA